MTEGTVFCSESCFSQSRRATFKRAKTCDWCKHVRHAVSYVDFHDGATQLQFCSDKCLNQYKMQIFCRETQAHLDLNPHLKDKLTNEAGEDNLITPDLWLKNCRSRTPSPATDDRSQSVSPPSVSIIPQPNPKPVVVSTQSEPSVTVTLSQTLSEALKKPLISVTPSSKLLSRDILQSPSTRIHKTNKKRRVSSRLPLASQNSNSSSSNASNNGNQPKPNPGNKFAAPITNIPDLRAKFAAQMQSQNNNQKPQQIPPFQHRHPFLPPPPPPNFFHPRPPFMPQRHPQSPATSQNQMHPPPDRINLNPLGFNSVPPITVLVPYPVILPLPIPIPIPIPHAELFKAFQKKSPTSNSSESVHNNSVESQENISYESQIETVEETEDEPPNDQPIDYTKAKTPSLEKLIESPKEIIQENPSHITVEVTDNRSINNEVPSNAAVFDENENTGEVPISGQNNLEHRLPKFKITRLNPKRILTKESESSRPLRKRKRIIVEANNNEEEEVDEDNSNA